MLGSTRILAQARAPFDEISSCRTLEGLEAQTDNEYEKSRGPAPTFSKGTKGTTSCKAQLWLV